MLARAKWWHTVAHPIRLGVMSGLAMAVVSQSLMGAPPEAGTIEGVQMPAWVERAGLRTALTPGMGLQSGDRIRTGDGARLLLRMAEGSHIKLGENAEFNIQDFVAPPEPRKGRFRGVFEVLRGAFRYTTSALSQPLRRDLDIRISAVTVGIRGTDIWGKSSADRDLVCLIEGQIQVNRGKDLPVPMRDPLSFYVAPRGKAPLPVKPVSEAQLRKWSQETELMSGAGVLRVTGAWAVNLGSYLQSRTAQNTARRFSQAGYAAAVQRAKVRGKTWHRVAVSGFETLADARAFARRIKGRLGVGSPWVSHNP